MPDLKKSAIQAAVDGNWEEAIKLNKQLSSASPEDVAILNRLAYAYLQTGADAKARDIYKEILRLEPNHPLAEKNLRIVKKRLSKNSSPGTNDKVKRAPEIFLHEPGLTKQVPLVNTAVPETLVGLQIGEETRLLSTKKCIEVRTLTEIYIGSLPDDISFHLSRLLKEGNEYSSHIKNIDPPHVFVFIRELKRSSTVTRATFHSFNNVS